MDRILREFNLVEPLYRHLLGLPKARSRVAISRRAARLPPERDSRPVEVQPNDGRQRARELESRGLVRSIGRHLVRDAEPSATPLRGAARSSAALRSSDRRCAISSRTTPLIGPGAGVLVDCFRPGLSRRRGRVLRREAQAVGPDRRRAAEAAWAIASRLIASRACVVSRARSRPDCSRAVWSTPATPSSWIVRGIWARFKIPPAPK
jgi:hypothetical protein